MKLLVASDHAGYPLKEALLQEIGSQHAYQVEDLGPPNAQPVDYPDYAHALSVRLLQDAENSLGVLICGTGIGMSMAANRHHGVRAALCTDPYMATMARMHNNANVLCLGARIVGQGLAQAILAAFLEGRFDGGRHATRVAKIDNKQP